jgi:Protein of unknown function (DUF2950)
MSRNHISIALAGLLMIVFGCVHEQSPPATNPVEAQLTFDSPDAAVQALVAGVSAHDLPQLEKILGPEGDDVLDSGDDVADHQAGQKFVNAYNQKHELTKNDDGSFTLGVGDDDWPLPIPLVQDANGKWIFDTDAGRDEIINRRIGRNELDVIEVCKAICDAQQEYARRDPDHDGVPEYARKIISDPGTKDGLYWPTAPGEPPSPLGELAADASAEGYALDPAHRDQPHPYHGYYYRLLTSQGPHASGGEMDYVINGKLLGGYALVAWPADYGNSGIMTFITNYQGDVYQKDLGEQTDAQANAIQSFDPDSTWKKAE